MSEQFYAIWKYHSIAAPRLIENAEDLAALGPEWCESPAAANAYAVTPIETVITDSEQHAAAEAAEIHRLTAENQVAQAAAAERAMREQIEADEAELQQLLDEEAAAKAAEAVVDGTK